MHYHMISGLHGYLPDQNEPHETESEASNALLDFVEQCRESDESRAPINVYSHNLYAEFDSGHGVEYAEVADCTEADCEAEMANI